MLKEGYAAVSSRSVAAAVDIQAHSSTTTTQRSTTCSSR